MRLSQHNYCGRHLSWDTRSSGNNLPNYSNSSTAFYFFPKGLIFLCGRALHQSHSIIHKLPYFWASSRWPSWDSHFWKQHFTSYPMQWLNHYATIMFWKATATNYPPGDAFSSPAGSIPGYDITCGFLWKAINSWTIAFSARLATNAGLPWTRDEWRYWMSASCTRCPSPIHWAAQPRQGEASLFILSPRMPD